MTVTPELVDAERDRGRTAERPTEVGVRGAVDVAARVKRAVKRDDVALLAAGVAFYALLALVPALVALVSVYGLVADPADIRRNVDDALSAAPAEVRDLVGSQLSDIVGSSPSGLRLGAIVGVAVALWAASGCVKHLMTAINRAYHEEETRGFVALRGTAGALTVALLVVGVVGLGIVVGAEVVAPDDGALRSLALVVRWPLAALLVVAGLALLYRYAPDRDQPRWDWASPGALFATLAWLVASIGFSIYTANFSNYNETYGALGAIVVVMLWLWIGAFAVIAGAELNSEMERQTVRDTTRGAPEPLGARDAYAADTLGERAGQRPAGSRG
ncbi:MAG TPA: YihY/virulence factor BrkB family protein [Acidimicrobiales bacterium]|jgi:membrane protein